MTMWPRAALPVAVFLGWAILLGAGLLTTTLRAGIEPVDYQTYQRAAAALARGASPYQTPAQSLAIWRSYHRLEAAIRAGHSLDGSGRASRGDPFTQTRPGPYPPPRRCARGRPHARPAQEYGATMVLTRRWY